MRIAIIISILKRVFNTKLCVVYWEGLRRMLVYYILERELYGIMRISADLVKEFSRPKCVGFISRLDVRKRRSAQQRQAKRWLKMLDIDLVVIMIIAMMIIIEGK